MTVRVVFDGMVFLQGAARGDGPAGACLRLASDKHIQLLLSDEILDEIYDVLTRPKIRQRFPALNVSRVQLFLEHVRAVAEIATDIPQVVVLERDPKDEKYLNLALAAEARYLVSRDRDLLDLMGTSPSPGSSFRDVYPLLSIVDPVTFLRTLSRKRSNVGSD